MTTDLDALLAAVLADPADDNIRLIYADALDEAGQHDRAEFIRVQCELARRADEVCGSHPRVPGGQHTNGPCRCPRDLRILRGRSAELHADNREKWWPADGLELDWRRGFVESVRCTAEQWVFLGDTIRARHPLERVTLTTVPALSVRPHPVTRMLDHRGLAGDPQRRYFTPADVDEATVQLVLARRWRRDRDEIPAALLSLRWPGVAFSLPGPLDGTRSPGGYFDPYRDADFTLTGRPARFVVPEDMAAEITRPNAAAASVAACDCGPACEFLALPTTLRATPSPVAACDCGPACEFLALPTTLRATPSPAPPPD